MEVFSGMSWVPKLSYLPRGIGGWPKLVQILAWYPCRRSNMCLPGQITQAQDDAKMSYISPAIIFFWWSSSHAEWRVAAMLRRRSEPHRSNPDPPHPPLPCTQANRFSDGVSGQPRGIPPQATTTRRVCYSHEDPGEQAAERQTPSRPCLSGGNIPSPKIAPLRTFSAHFTAWPTTPPTGIDCGASQSWSKILGHDACKAENFVFAKGNFASNVSEEKRSMCLNTLQRQNADSLREQYMISPATQGTSCCVPRSSACRE